MKPLSAAAMHALMECNAGRVSRAVGSAIWHFRDDGQAQPINAATMRALFARGLIRADRFGGLGGGTKAQVTVAGHRVVDDYIASERGDQVAWWENGEADSTAIETGRADL